MHQPYGQLYTEPPERTLETGIDFMQNSKVHLGEDLRLGTNPYESAWQMQNNVSTWDIVQMFLRKIKGLPDTPQGKHAFIHTILFENELQKCHKCTTDTEIPTYF